MNNEELNTWVFKLIDTRFKEQQKTLEEEKKEQYDKLAVEFRNMYDSFIKKGFTAEQAWELTKLIIVDVTNTRKSLKEDN